MKNPVVLAIMTFLAIVIVGALLVPLYPGLKPGAFGDKMFYVAFISSVIAYFLARNRLKSKSK